MKNNWLLIPAFALLVSFGITPVVKAEEAKKGKDYAALASKYEKLAAEQDAVIAEHEGMKVSKAKQHPGKPGLSENDKMNKHCNAIIKDAKKLKADYESFAAFCKLMAKEGVK